MAAAVMFLAITIGILMWGGIDLVADRLDRIATALEKIARQGDR